MNVYKTKTQEWEFLKILLSMTIPIRMLGYPRESIQLLHEGEEIAKKRSDQSALAQIYGLISHFYAMSGDATKGVTYAEKWLNEAHTTPDYLNNLEIIAPFIFDLCSIYNVAGEYYKINDYAPKVLSLIEKGKKELETFGKPYNLYPALAALYGCSLGYIGNFKEGKKRCEKATRIAYEKNNHFTIGFVELFHAYLYLVMGDGLKAMEHSEASIKSSKKANVAVLLGLSVISLGVAYYLCGKYKEAMDCLNRGAAIHTDGNQTYYLSLYHYTLSQIYYELNQMDKAKKCCEKAVKLSRDHHERHVEGASLMFLGKINAKQDLPTAESLVDQGMKIFNSLKIKPYYAIGYLYLGELYLNMNQKEKARSYLKKAMDYFTLNEMNYWLEKANQIHDSLHGMPGKNC